MTPMGSGNFEDIAWDAQKSFAVSITQPTRKKPLRAGASRPIAFSLAFLPVNTATYKCTCALATRDRLLGRVSLRSQGRRQAQGFDAPL
jgi:hypothetical protein